jgi:hypothetical protein
MTCARVILPSSGPFGLIMAHAFTKDERSALAAARGTLVPPEDLQEALVAAAATGWVEAMGKVNEQANEAKTRLYPDYALDEAAYGGHTEAIGAAMAPGATRVNWALTYAAVKGHIAAMQKLYDWGATDFGGRATMAAIKGKQPEAQALLAAWQAEERERRQLC